MANRKLEEEVETYKGLNIDLQKSLTSLLQKRGTIDETGVFRQ